MIEVHPFGVFVPKKTKYLLLGSFTTKEAYDDSKKVDYEWFYSSKRNQFWPILELVYSVKLQTKQQKEKLFSKLGIAVTDIILSCERKNNSNLDVNLYNIVFAIKEIDEILDQNQITRIYFTSRFVEGKFKSKFRELTNRYPNLELITLPSPSPRYATLNKFQKAEVYKELLPKLI